MILSHTLYPLKNCHNFLQMLSVEIAQLKNRLKNIGLCLYKFRFEKCLLETAQHGVGLSFRGIFDDYKS
ncbi:hypothetical protein KUL17_13840 [Alteromonas sp. KUL17]|nr:hypothetical protein KUL17_13840 [Alteromonas sp. KUL17]